ncbi:hypothetical protein R1T43_03225 [Alteromonas sp. CI.11.F.A3]|uniref:hypothetical protein n=1 Tax=Alteromonas sp. CI.11.F.A3 TaxID=3079555 RepID=UPI002943DCC7|nr:hypothetical protein [Alteromonas sp. CI.11.F.A3]WOI38070.1 hypothetical protein R1T43_03225 [Alteromonas sp. CI.11.F.A3]
MSDKEYMSSIAKRNLVWLGAGNVEGIDVDLQGFSNCYLVEANQDVCQVLQQRYSNVSNIHVLNSLIDDSSELVPFNIANLNALSSSSKCKDVKRHYPGYRVVNAENLKPSTLSDLLTSVMLEQDNNMLIIDLYAGVGGILKQLFSSDFAKTFGNVAILGAEVRYFEDSLLPDEITRLMQANSYIPTQQTATAEGVQYQHYLLNPLVKELECTKNTASVLESELSSARQKLLLEEQQSTRFAAEIEAYSNLAESLENQVNHAEQRNQELLKELDRINQDNESILLELAQTRSEYEETKASSASQLKEIEELRESIDSKKLTLDSLEAKSASDDKALSELTTRLANVEGELDENKQKNASLLDEKLKIEEAFKEKEKWLSEHEKWNASLQHELEKLKADLITANEDVDIQKQKVEVLLTKEQALQEQTFRNDKLTLELEKFDAQLQMLARFVKV